MPEGDSVFRLAAKLRPLLVGHTVIDGELRSGDAAGARLAGLRLDEIETHGKHLLMRFDDATTLHTHLRMQGSWSVTRLDRPLPRSRQDAVRVRMVTDERMLWGIDIPVVDLVPTRDEVRLVGHLGPDPLRPDWDAYEAARRLARDPSRSLVAALLDQRNMAGLGNLWVNEVAFLRGIHPFRRIRDVDLPPLVALAARALRISATVPGMYQVTTGNGRKGETHWVSGRAGRPCLRCGTTIRVQAEVANDPGRRRTWWCPHCQPE